MSKKVPFTEEQLRVLELNPYTYSVSSNRITFTLEFKKFFVDQIRTHRKTTPEVLKELDTIRLGLHKDAKAACVDVFLMRQIPSVDSVLRVVFRQNNSLLHLKRKIFPHKKQMPALRNCRNELFI